MCWRLGGTEGGTVIAGDYNLVGVQEVRWDGGTVRAGDYNLVGVQEVRWDRGGHSKSRGL